VINNSIEAGHGRLNARLRPMRSLKRLRSARVISAGHAFVQISVGGTMNSARTSIDGIRLQRSSQNSSAPSDQANTVDNFACFCLRNGAIVDGCWARSIPTPCARRITSPTPMHRRGGWSRPSRTRCLSRPPTHYRRTLGEEHPLSQAAAGNLRHAGTTRDGPLRRGWWRTRAK
jgi:hypothetical protein